MKIKQLSFDKVLTDSTSKFNKIKKENYQQKGIYRVIDQGQDFIGGYTNDRNLVNQLNVPVIVFGDHTKALKYIDFPFAIGADGVKVLERANDNIHPKYVYYFLQTIKLPEAGYSRHFKYLKEINIPIPDDIDDQKRIAIILNKAEKLIAQRKETIRLLDEFLKSVFLDMFGDPVKNEKGWERTTMDSICTQITDGEHITPIRTDNGIKLLSARNIKDGYLDFQAGLDFIGQDEYDRISKRCKPEKNDILMSCSGSVGRVSIIDIDEPLSLVRSVALLKLNKQKIHPLYVQSWMQSPYFQYNIRKGAKTSSQSNIFTGAIKKLPIIIPEIALQNKFASIVENTETLKQQYKASLRELENLYGSLSQRAFKGELDLNKVPIGEEPGGEIPEHIRPPESKESTDKKEIKDEDFLNFTGPETDEDKRYGDPFEGKELPDEELISLEKAKELLGDEWEDITEPGTGDLALPGKAETITKYKTENGGAIYYIPDNRWEKYNDAEIAEIINAKFYGLEFNAEMLIDYLTNNLGLQIKYFNSEELKSEKLTKNKRDFKTWLFDCITSGSASLKLQQFYYDQYTSERSLLLPSDYAEKMQPKQNEEAVELTGIYFRILT